MERFEYDPNKSVLNKDKHGIDFEEAQSLWSDPGRIEAKLPLERELRYAVVGQINRKHWTAVITYRDEYVRIISVRASRSIEIRAYELRS